jgi:hypothetical protein
MVLYVLSTPLSLSSRRSSAMRPVWTEIGLSDETALSEALWCPSCFLPALAAPKLLAVVRTYYT